MKSFCVALSSLFFLALAAVTDAATMSATFEKSLGERLAVRKATVDAYPSLKYATYLPDDVPTWKILPMSNLLEDIRVFKGSIEVLIPAALRKDPANTAAINKFTQDCNDFVVFFEAGVKSGDISDASGTPPATTRPATTRPATPPPTTTTSTTTTTTATPPPTMRSTTTDTTTAPPRSTKDDSGSEEDDDTGLDLPSYTYTPYTYTPYTWTPSPTYYYPSYSTPSPYTYYYDTVTYTKFAAWKICLIVLSIIIAIIRFIYWMNQRQIKQKQKEEEEAAAAAALQMEAGETSHANYVVITAAENQTHPGAAVPVKM